MTYILENASPLLSTFWSLIVHRYFFKKYMLISLLLLLMYHWYIKFTGFLIKHWTQFFYKLLIILITVDTFKTIEDYEERESGSHWPWLGLGNSSRWEDGLLKFKFVIIKYVSKPSKIILSSVSICTYFDVPPWNFS